MNDRTYVYAIHIATTPEKLWEALTSNDFISQYFEVWRFESDWKTGSPVKYFEANGNFYSQGEVVESDPPNRLSYTWPEPEAERKYEQPELLTWEIAETGPGTVSLKLVHERLTEEYYKGVSQGWPAIISSLKSLLEGGTPLAFHPQGASAVTGESN